MLLAHLTDIHVADAREYVAPADQRWHARIAKHSRALLDEALRDLSAQRPDHVVLTGDFTQTSRHSEFLRARAHLDAHLAGVRLSVIPGNHDVWSREAVEGRWFERSFGGNIRCDLGGTGFPYCHLIGDSIALLALDSSPFEPGADPSRVKGRITAEQLARLEGLAGHERLRGRFLVLLLHHHLRLSPEDAALEDPKDPTPLEDAAALEETLARLPIGLVLHGHRHKQMRLDLRLGNRDVPVLCPGSATRVHERPDRTGRYGLYELDGDGLVSARIRAWDAARRCFDWVP